MSRRLQVFLLVTVLFVAALGLVPYVISDAALNVGSFDYSRTRVTPDVIGLCPGYVKTGGGRIIHVRNDEGMTGGRMTIQLELSADRLAEFLAVSPFRDVTLQSIYVSDDFDSWLPSGRFNELGKSRAFSAASVSMGRSSYSILIDRTRTDILVIYIRSFS